LTQNFDPKTLEEDIIKIICRYFSRKGYSCRKDVLHEDNIKFVPDLICKKDDEQIIFEIRTGRVLRKYEIERIGLYVRVFIDSKFYICVPSYTTMGFGSKKLIHQLGIGLIKIVNGALEFIIEPRSYTDVINQLSDSYNVYYYFKNRRLMDEEAQRELTLFFDTFRKNLNFLSQYNARLREIIGRYSERIKLRIPEELLYHLNNLHNIRYANELRDFEEKYQRMTFYENEHKLILKTLKKLWTRYRKERGAGLFEAFKEFEPLLKEEPWYRDHMIHPFQVFLMGSIIIDRFYEKILESYKRRLQNADERDLDFAWLLCSTFHDFCYPIQMFETLNRKFLKKFLQVKAELPIYLQTERVLLEGEQLKLIDQLVSLYKHYKENSVGASWIFDDKCIIDNKIRLLFLKQMIENKNHAPLSALALLNTISKERIARMSYNYRQTTFSTAVYPAALAIVLHDNSILQEIPENYNISFENMPLQFLLIYCDTAQEFGRTDSNESCLLKNFDLQSNFINIQLVFTDEKKYKSKCEEVEKVYEKITSNSLEFKLTLMYNGIEHSVTTKKSEF